MILSIETSGVVCSIALGWSGEYICVHTQQVRRHGPQLLGQIDQLLGKASLKLSDLKGVAVSIGPGNFTGLRLAIGIAQGIAFGHDLPVVPVDSLMGQAYQAYRTLGCQKVFVLNNAFMGQIYSGFYRCHEEGVIVYRESSLIYPADFDFEIDDDVIVIGNAMAVYPELSKNIPNSSEVMPSAESIAFLGETVLREGKAISPQQLEAKYLRDRNAWKT